MKKTLAADAKYKDIKLVDVVYGDKPSLTMESSSQEALDLINVLRYRDDTQLGLSLKPFEGTMVLGHVKEMAFPAGVQVGVLRGLVTQQVFHTEIMNFGTGQVAGRDIINNGQRQSIKPAPTLNIGFMRITLTVKRMPECQLLGSGDLVLTGVQEKQLSLSLKGSGCIRAQGSTATLSATLMGSGDLKLKRLQADRAEVVLTGSGTIKVRAEDSLNATLIGSGDIKIYGTPAARQGTRVGTGHIVYKDCVG